jgi:hypothetical protein
MRVPLSTGWCDGLTLQPRAEGNDRASAPSLLAMDAPRCLRVMRKCRTIGVKFTDEGPETGSLTAVPLSVPSNGIVPHLPFHCAGVTSFCASQPLRRPNSPSCS